MEFTVRGGREMGDIPPVQQVGGSLQHADWLVDGILVNGKKVRATSDTGSNGTFQITPGAMEQLGLEEEEREAKAGHSVGFNGAAANRKGKVKNITLGGISLKRPAVVFISQGSGYDDAAWDIRIGNAFLKNFVLTVDYQERTITLEKPAPFRSHPRLARMLPFCRHL